MDAASCTGWIEREVVQSGGVLLRQNRHRPIGWQRKGVGPYTEEGGLIRVGGVGHNRVVGESKMELALISKIEGRVPSFEPKTRTLEAPLPCAHAVVSRSAAVVEVANDEGLELIHSVVLAELERGGADAGDADLTPLMLRGLFGGRELVRNVHSWRYLGSRIPTSGVLRNGLRRRERG